MKRINRRQFIKRMVITAAGSYVSLAGNPANAIAGMMGGGGMGGSGTTVIDPPVGAAYRDPVEIPSAITTEYINGQNRRIVNVALEAKPTVINVNGISANLMTYNGTFPGPTIRVQKGDILRLNFTNSLPQGMYTNILGHPMYSTNLHTHGLHVSPEGIADNVMRVFEPGRGDMMYGPLYEYDTSAQEASSMHFYHPHIHGNVAEQMWSGMQGALIVEDDPSIAPILPPKEKTHVFVLRDLSLVGSNPSPHDSMMDYMQGLEGNIVMVNGQVNPKLTMQPGQVQRWRMVNASNARFYRLSLESQSTLKPQAIYLIGTDGGLLDKPYPLTELLLSPGERIDVLVKAAPTKDTYKLKSLAYNRGGMSNLQTVTLLTAVSSGITVNDTIPTRINPSATKLSAPANAPRKSLVLSMGQGRGYINGISFEGMDKTYKMMSNLGDTEVWEISNQSGMDHPFHQHVNAAQVLSISGGDANYAALYTKIPAWKDVLIVPKWGTITLLVPVKDYPGMSMFHCHILEHEDIGMMGLWHIMDMSM